MKNVNARNLGFILGSSGLALALALGGVAHADSKVASGIECHALEQPEVVNGQGLSHGFTGIKNLAANQQPRSVMCPIAVDVTSNTAGLATQSNGVSLKLSGVLFNTSRVLTCLAMSVTQYGSIVQSVQRTSPSPVVAGNVSLDWGSSLNTSANHGSYAFQCTLPYGASISAIEYNEP